MGLATAEDKTGSRVFGCFCYQMLFYIYRVVNPNISVWSPRRRSVFSHACRYWALYILILVQSCMVTLFFVIWPLPKRITCQKV